MLGLQGLRHRSSISCTGRSLLPRPVPRLPRKSGDFALAPKRRAASNLSRVQGAQETSAYSETVVVCLCVCCNFPKPSRYHSKPMLHVVHSSFILLTLAPVLTPGLLRHSGERPPKIRGSHLSNTTCLTQVFFESGE